VEDPVKGLALSMLLLVAAAPAVSRAGRGDQQVLPSFTGTVRGADSKMLLLERQDENTMEFACTKKTRYFEGAKRIKPSDIHAGDRVTVEAGLGPDGKPEAVNVRLIARQKPR
jgi:hypothetical protein